LMRQRRAVVPEAFTPPTARDSLAKISITTHTTHRQ
jgi:hypothetical protein